MNKKNKKKNKNKKKQKEKKNMKDSKKASKQLRKKKRRYEIIDNQVNKTDEMGRMRANFQMDFLIWLDQEQELF